MSSYWKVAALLGYTLFPALLLPQQSSADEPAARERGVWQKHEYSFVFLGFTSTYSCDGLADKIRVLLIAAGARQDAKSQPGACAADYGRPDIFARANLTFYTLAPSATDKTSSSPQLDAGWRPVVFADRVPRELHTGDCELVEQFRDNVMPMFTTRNIDDHTLCIPNQNSGSLISLHFESFTDARPVTVRPAPQTRSQ
jgi:hypothetical protein